jgi:hypothetical protein
MNIKEFTVKQSTGFALKVKSWKCLSPADLNSIEFINESYNDDGEITHLSTYNFFMTDDEIKTLCEGMLK